VIFVSALSLWALVASHGAWWAAASVEVRQAEEDVAGDVVEEIVANPAPAARAVPEM
jgi:hypothetical protein